MLQSLIYRSCHVSKVVRTGLCTVNPAYCQNPDSDLLLLCYSYMSTLAITPHHNIYLVAERVNTRWSSRSICMFCSATAMEIDSYYNIGNLNDFISFI